MECINCKEIQSVYVMIINDKMPFHVTYRQDTNVIQIQSSFFRRSKNIFPLRMRIGNARNMTLWIVFRQIERQTTPSTFFIPSRTLALVQYKANMATSDSSKVVLWGCGQYPLEYFLRGPKHKS
jgi:hypothetical protein